MHLKKVFLVGECLSKRRPQESLIFEQTPLVLRIYTVASKVPALDLHNNSADPFFDYYDIGTFAVKAGLEINLSFWIKIFF